METITTAPAKINLFRELILMSQEHTARKEWYSKETGHLYLIRIDHRSGKSKVIKDTFLKIGISTQMDLYSRFNMLPRCFTITIIEDMILPLADVRRLEKAIHSQYRSYQYIPKLKRWGGKTECFKSTLLEAFPSLADLITALKPRAEVDNSNPCQIL